jgi:hypothetical protein
LVFRAVPSAVGECLCNGRTYIPDLIEYADAEGDPGGWESIVYAVGSALQNTQTFPSRDSLARAITALMRVIEIIIYLYECHHQ